MATKYSSYSKGWTPSGSSTARHYRARLDYSASETPTSFTVSGRCSVNVDYSVNANYSGYLSVAGSRYPTSGYTSCSTEYGGDKTVTCISTKTKTIQKTTEPQTIKITAAVRSSTGSWSGELRSVSQEYTVPALNSYSVTFDANGGEGAPATQAKYYSISLTLSNIIPTRYKYSFVEWNTMPDGTGDSYQPGSTYTGNASITLYAIWQKVIPDFYVKVNNTWRNSEPYIKVNGQWRLITDAYVKVGGTWKDVT